MIVAAGGNGVEFGIQVAGRPGHWITTPASVPNGIYDPGYGEADGIGAIGDSAVVDMFGLGAMAAAFSPAQAEALESVLPEGFHRYPAKLLAAVHREFNSVSPLFGLTAQRVADSELSPIIALGILDKTGAYGRIGGGIYRPPVELFKQAMVCLHSPKGLSDAGLNKLSAVELRGACRGTFFRIRGDPGTDCPHTEA